MKSMKTILLVLVSFSGISTIQAAEINMKEYLAQTIETQSQQVSETLSVQFQQSMSQMGVQFFHEQGVLLNKPHYQEAITNKQINNTTTLAE